MKLSIVIPVLNSHEVVRRQLLHFSWIAIRHDVEVILVDDGSDPVIEGDGDVAMIVRTHDKRPWTQPKARNIGARHATGDYLLFTDIDHIVTPQAADFASTLQYDYARFRREFGLLDSQGRFSQDAEAIVAMGVPRERIKRRGMRLACHTLSMVIRRSLFEEIGGFREKLLTYPTHDDGHMKRVLKKLQAVGRATKCPDDERPMIYMIPNGRYCGDRDANPSGLFHNLTR